MLLFLGAIVAAAALVGALRVGRRGDADGMGWMSEKWLAEYRASHPA